MEEWQLPALDSRQWEKMNAPIGLAVAVRHLSTLRFREQSLRVEEQIQEDINDDIQQQITWQVGRNEGIGLGGKYANEEMLPSSFGKEFIEPEIPSAQILNQDEETLKSETATEILVGSNAVDLESIDEMAEASSIQGRNEEENLDRVREIGENDERKQPLAVPIDDTNNGSGQFSEACPDWLQLVDVAETNEKETEQMLATVDDDSSKRGETTELIEHGDAKNDTNLTTVMSSSPILPIRLESNLESAVTQIDSDQNHDVDPCTIIEQGGLISSTTKVGTVQREDETEQVQIGSDETKEKGMMDIDEARVDDKGEKTHLAVSSAEMDTKEGTPDSNNSDTESDFSTNIFRGIGPAVSFSEDEEDGPELYVKREIAQKFSLLDLRKEETVLDGSDDPDSTLQMRNDDDDITVAISNVSPEVRKYSSQGVDHMTRYRHENKNGTRTASWEIETDALQVILVKLPDDDHRSMLSQLLIMTNAKDRISRINIAFQVQDSLLAVIEKNSLEVETEKAVQLIFHLARLKKSYRTIFGRSIFNAMSKLYKQSEQRKRKISSGNKNKREKKQITVDPDALVEEKNGRG